MFKVKNNLNQPLSISNGSLPAGGEIQTRNLDDELRRLESKGHVTIVEPEDKKKETTKP